MSDGGIARPDGVLFDSEDRARRFAESRDREVIQVAGGWLAVNRTMSPMPMPDERGRHRHSPLRAILRVWTVTSYGAQEPDPNVSPCERRNRLDAERMAREWVAHSGHRIFLFRQTPDKRGWRLLPDCPTG
jgi:hypothetical protein